MQVDKLLQQTIKDLVKPGTGILAADESVATIGKRFATINLENTEANRQDYRALLATCDNLAKYISGVILFSETFSHKTKQQESIVSAFSKAGIVPGIKVDKGLVALADNSVEKTTQGLDNLANELISFRELGARFAKWRCVYTISETTPTKKLNHINAQTLSRYASICQQVGVVPIVEPEVLMDGEHSIDKCAQVTEEVLREVFVELAKHNVKLEHMILKPNMVLPGSSGRQHLTAEDISTTTLKVLRRTVPAAVPAIFFLSGGQSSISATVNLNALNQSKQPWHLSFSYGRALQEDCISAWKGKDENVALAKATLLLRAKLNGLANLGEYNEVMEAEIETVA